MEGGSLRGCRGAEVDFTCHSEVTPHSSKGNSSCYTRTVANPTFDPKLTTEQNLDQLTHARDAHGAAHTNGCKGSRNLETGTIIVDEDLEYTS